MNDQCLSVQWVTQTLCYLGCAPTAMLGFIYPNHIFDQMPRRATHFCEGNLNGLIQGEADFWNRLIKRVSRDTTLENPALQRLQSQMTRCVYPAECKQPTCDMVAKGEVTMYKLNLIMLNVSARLCIQVEGGTMLLSTNQ